MKNSEMIKKFAAKIQESMIESYKTAIECEGRIEYQIYIWEDGEVERLQTVSGDNSYLKAKDSEPRKLVYVTTVKGCNPYDCADEAIPEDEAEREAMKAELIDWLMDEYKAAVSEKLEEAIEREENEEKYFGE